MSVHQQIITDPKMPLYESDSEDEPSDSSAGPKETVNRISGKMFGEVKRGFLNDKKQKTTDESIDSVVKMQKEEEKREQKQAKQKVKKIYKQAEYEYLMSEQPEVEQKKEEPPKPIKCGKCPKMIKPNDPYYKINCSDECHIDLDADCFKNEMIRQGKAKKKDQKDAVCFTDSCAGKIYDILFRNLVDGKMVDTTYLVCNARSAETTKEGKKMPKKMVKHNESTNRASLESASETKESTEVDVQQEVEEAKEPAEAPPRPIDLNAPVHRLEKHDEIANKYGLNVQDNEIGKKDKERKKKNEKTVVTLNVIDKKIEEMAYRKRNESNDFEEHQLRESRETSSTPLRETNDFPLFAEPQPSSTLRNNANEDFEAEMLDQRLLPRVEDLDNLENLFEEIKQFKESILGNCPDQGELYELRRVFMLVLSDKQIHYTRSGQKLENVRKSVENVLHYRHLTSADGGLAKKFLDLTKWFTISKMGGKILFKKKPQATIVTSSNVMPESTLIAQTTIVPPPIERKPIKSPFTSMEKEHLNKWNGPEECSKKIMDKLRISTNDFTSSSTSNETQKEVNIPIFTLFNSRTVVPSLSTIKQFISPPGIPNAPTGDFNYPPGISAMAQQPTQLIAQPVQPTWNDGTWNDIELENNRLKEKLEKALKERDEANNAYLGFLRENMGLYKLRDFLKAEIDGLKASANAQEQRFKEEQNFWAAEKEQLVKELNRVKLVKDDPKVQLLQTELTKLQEDTHLSMEKRTAFKRKGFAEGTMHHIDLICTSLQSLLIEDRMGADEKNLRWRQLKDFEKIHLDWDGIHRATVKRLHELETNGTSDTVIPEPPNFTNICMQLYTEFMQKPIAEMKTPVMEILKEIHSQVQSQCARHEIEQPNELKLKYLIAQYVATNCEIMGVSRVIDKGKCMNYVLDQLGVPRRYGSTDGFVWQQQQQQQPSPSATLSVSSFPSTSTHNYSQTKKTSAISKSGPREIDFAAHECQVCFEVLGTKESAKQCTACYEPFHHECIKPWLMQTASQTNSCPNCKMTWPDEEAYPSL